MDRYNDDVELALQDYQTAIQLEDQAKKVWQDRLNLEENPPQKPTTNQTEMLKKSIGYFRKRFKVRQKSRQKKKKDLDKRQAAREKAKTEVDLSFEKKENWVYKEGDNYNIRWSAMPRYKIIMFSDRYQQSKSTTSFSVILTTNWICSEIEKTQSRFMLS